MSYSLHHFSARTTPLTRDELAQELRHAGWIAKCSDAIEYGQWLPAGDIDDDLVMAYHQAPRRFAQESYAKLLRALKPLWRRLLDDLWAVLTRPEPPPLPLETDALEALQAAFATGDRATHDELYMANLETSVMVYQGPFEREPGADQRKPEVEAFLNTATWHIVIESSGGRNPLTCAFVEPCWRAVGAACGGYLYNPQDGTWRLAEPRGATA